MSYIDDPLVVDIVEPPSVDSSLNHSRSDSWQAQLSTSHPSNRRIKFAPLPQLGNRKRRSTVPLGVAARAQIMRGRREYVESRHKEKIHSPMGRGSERPIHRQVDKNKDSLTALGKVVKGVWRCVLKKGRQLGSRDMETSHNKRHGVDVRDLDRMDLVEEEAGEWEDEGMVHFPEDISQTETLRDSSLYSWRTTAKPIQRDAGG